MTYAIVLILVIIMSSLYYYYRPSKKNTKNIFNAEYYRGLNYLLNNEEDKAFKIFAALMDVDSSTIETHLALGGLYRKRGEFDKAILIHQNLLSRPTLESELKQQALYELAKDFHSAGLYDRAEKIFNNLSEIKRYKMSCLEHLLTIYEVTKDWEKAIEIVKSVDSQKMNNQRTDKLLAQYYCEISSIYYEENQIEKAIAISKKSLKTCPDCIRPNMQLAYYYKKNDINVAIQYYESILSQHKLFCRYIVMKIIDLSKNIKSSTAISRALISISKNKDLPFISDIYLYMHYENEIHLAKSYVDSFDLSKPINKFLISHAMACSQESIENNIMHNIVDSYKSIFSVDYYFICNNCGYKSNELNWLCPSCNTWEEIAPKSTADLINDNGIIDAKK